MKATKFFFGLVLFMFLGQAVFAQNINKNESNIAIEGYDPVAYFSEGKAVKGFEKFTFDQDGTVYHFSSKENLKSFKKNPGKYTPQYGGWCAYAVSKGGKYPINPETFKIVNGKLYLFYNKDGTNTLELWNKDEASILKLADESWDKEK